MTTPSSRPPLELVMGRKGKPPKPPVPKDWRKDFVLLDRGGLQASAHNVGLILRCDERVNAMFVLNEFANRIELRRAPPWGALKEGEFSASDLTRLEQWLGSPDGYSLSCKPDLLERCVYAASEANRVHPVREYLNGLEWDGVERLPELFVRHFGTVDTPYARQVGVVFGISAVARAMVPACKVDFMVVLEGVQGAGKGMGIAALFGDDWYAEAMESPQHKDFYVGLQGRWCIEIGEMQAFSKADVNKVKQAITQRNDVFRAPYARKPESHARQCVFVGTTNERDWQRDPTGGRRYYPVLTGPKVDVIALRELRDQIWAEAVARFKRGELWHATPEGAVERQDEAYQEDAWITPIDDWLEGNCKDTTYVWQVKREGKRVMSCAMADLLDGALGLEHAKQTRAEQNRAGAILRRMGWESKQCEMRGERHRMWRRPPAPAPSSAPTTHPPHPIAHPESSACA